MNEQELKLVEIAAQILTGLLASGKYTFIQLSPKASGYGNVERACIRPEALGDALDLAHLLVQAAAGKGAKSDEN